MPTDDLFDECEHPTSKLDPHAITTRDAWWTLELRLRVAGYECLRAFDKPTSIHYWNMTTRPQTW